MLDNSSDYIFKAYIVNAFASDSGERENAGTWLYFPPTAEDINAAFEEIGLPLSSEPDKYFFDDYVTNIPGLRKVLPMYEHVDELAALSQGLADLPRHEQEKLLAVQDTPMRLTEYAQFREYPQNADYFCFLPQVTDDKALGLYYLHNSGMVDMPEDWKGGIEPEAFGRHIREQEQGVFSDKGYVILSGDEWEPERPLPKQDREQKTSVKDFLKQAKKECAARDTEITRPAKHEPER